MSNASSRHRAASADLAHRGGEVHTADVPPRRRRIGRTAALVATVSLLATACGNKPLDTFDDQGPAARDINNVILPVFGIAIIVLILVSGAILFTAWRNRVSAKDAEAAALANGTDADPTGLYGDDEFPEQVHGNTTLEIGWTVIPTVILSVVAVFTLIGIFKLNDVSADEGDLRVTIVGQQWWWEYQYHLDGDTDTPPDFVNANELVIPAGQQVPLVVTSRDVIHSWWIPQLNGKRDALPLGTSPWTIEADDPGRYKGVCTEFCGLSHAYMRMFTIALPPEDWDAWAENQILPATAPEAGTPEDAGWQIYQANCAQCHVITGLTDTNLDGEIDDWDIYDGPNQITPALVAGAAPNLTHFASRTVYAGSIFDLYVDRAEGSDYLDVAAEGDVDVGQLTAWLRNAPAEKSNRWQDGRGMPAFTNLTPDDITNLIAFLTSLD